jgi:carbamoyl-phosphate synthase large subunit
LVEEHINILLLGGAKRVSLAERFMAAGRKLDRAVKIFSYELDEYVPIGSIGKVIIGLKWKDKDIIDHLAETVRKENIHIVLPFVDPAIGICSRLTSACPNVFIPVSPEESCNIFFDKRKANDWFLANRFQVPEADNTYPLIAKPAQGSAAKGLIKIDDQAEYGKFKLREDAENYLLQRYIEADEYTVDCYIDQKGTVLATVPRRRVEITGGEVMKAITKRDESLMQLAGDIITKANLRGPVNVQFLKEKKTGAIFVMEINPRFGGGVICSIEAGANMPEWLIKEYLGLANEQVNDWQEDLLMMRTYREYFKYADNY